MHIALYFGSSKFKTSISSLNLIISWMAINMCHGACVSSFLFVLIVEIRTYRIDSEN